MNDEELTRRTLLRAAGVGAGAGLLPARALAADDTGDPLARAAAETDAVPRHLVPGARGTLPDGVPSGEGVDDLEQCYYQNNGKELYGPTDINAQTGNQGLSVALNGRGTVTVCKWPRPSFYDQVKYYASDRSADHYGADPNAGSFLGLRVAGDCQRHTEWLREWETTQAYVDDFSDTILTRYRSEDLGLTVEVRDVVAADDDALVRDVSVERDDGSPVETATLLAVANVNPVVSKIQRFPVSDWCLEETNQSIARYDDSVGAVVHERADVDRSTGEPGSVAVALGFAGNATEHQVGGDAYEEAATPLGRGGPTVDAYDDASDGTPLSGNGRFVGQSTAALARPVDPDGGTATVILAAAEDATGVGETLGSVRERDPADVRREKAVFFDEHVGDAPMPDTDDEAVRSLAARALVTLVQAYDPETATIVASVATQSPYGEDWPRDGAYFNYVLSALGKHDWVEAHNRFYARVQQGSTDAHPDPAIPPGNWAMNYYADGVPGGPIPYEIDETGYGVFTLYDHYAVTGDESYLEDVWPAIRRGADYLVQCKDPQTGLQCTAWEDDIPQPKQTIVGAATVWTGLDAAVNAAEALGNDAKAEEYRARRDELAAAIDAELFDDEVGAYGPVKAGFVMSEVAWPLGFRPSVGPAPENPLDHPRIQSHMDADWAELATTFAEPEAGNRSSGLYEAKGLVPLAKDRRSSGPGSLDQVREGLRWIAERHATPDTNILGEVWTVEETEAGEREVKSIISQPHVWEQVLFYMAALEAHPPEDLDFDPESYGGVLGALREQNAPDQRGPPDDVPGDPPEDPGRRE
ncbi:hypothetical protein [Halorarius halobius]|uniref:alpha-L-rhamnosidase-related protein n=1 Tax=Halorarius halobius TaxID=2962671 RepID=UPI0020CFADB9|nr:hypothetical protein [Halorarius halobius]